MLKKYYVANGLDDVRLEKGLGLGLRHVKTSAHLSNIVLQMHKIIKNRIDFL